MERVVIAKILLDELLGKTIVVGNKVQIETRFCAKCGLNNNLTITSTGTICGCCGIELTWH